MARTIYYTPVGARNRGQNAQPPRNRYYPLILALCYKYNKPSEDQFFQNPVCRELFLLLVPLMRPSCDCPLKQMVLERFIAKASCF
jgi:hypothetical protein